MGEKSPEWQIVKLCMKMKMIDEGKVNSELLKLKCMVSKTLERTQEKEGIWSRTRRKQPKPCVKL